MDTNFKPVSITDHVIVAYDNAIDKGWYDQPRSFGDVIALIHSEASEALDDYRNGRDVKEIWFEYKHPTLGLLTHESSDLMQWDGEVHQGKPCGIPTELADVVIRIFDACGYYGIDLEAAIAQKMAYNATRPARHGGKVL